MKPKSYREAGVDIEREDRTIASIVSQLAYRRQGLGSPIELPGFFTGLIDFGEWALTLNTDGVGTKLLVARDVGKWDTVGIDCVAMNVNDALCVGAEPLAVVDYLAVSEYDEEVARQIGIGLNRGAELANVTIIGGELATVPELVKGYDLAGTSLGYVAKDSIIDGSEVEPGQVLVGIPSSGLHSNGFTLARKLLQSSGASYEDIVPGGKETFGEAYLRPTEIYVKEVLRVLKACDVTAMAHITGGGLDNLARVRHDLLFEVSEPLRPQPIFEAMMGMGDIELKEMYRTFNMGMGYVLVMDEEEVEIAMKILRKRWEARVVGSVRQGEGVEAPSLGIAF